MLVIGEELYGELVNDNLELYGLIWVMVSVLFG